jgi:hypothetical protein
VTVEQALVERLLATTAVAALVSTRIYRMRLPQQPTLPAVRVQRISRVEDEYHLRGRANRFRSRIQVDVFASEYDAQNPDPLGTQAAVLAAIDGALAGAAFVDGGSPPSIRVQLITPANETEGYDAEELRQVKGSQDYFVTWSRV